MKFFEQFSIIFLICLLGTYISSILPFTFPGSVVSMIILFILLDKNIIKERSISTVGDFLLSNMAIFFIPASVAIMKNYSAIASILWKFALIIVISTIFTFFISSKSVSLVIYLQEKKQFKKDKKNATN
ncbi:MAG: CidA/LrgA family protein [Sphaerochaeta sp.]